MAERKRYLSYLWRLWRENGRDAPRWHASLESAQDSDRQNFTNLDDPVALLRLETGSNWFATIIYQSQVK